MVAFERDSRDTETVSPDYRSDPMESPEGKGIARRAWERYAEAVNRSPVAPYLTRVLKPYGASTAADLIGFWVVWHLHGGFEGLRELGMSRATIYRKVKRFRQVTGQHPDEFRLKGVKLDVAEYLDQK